jgi:TetR/AcrR family transcriptional repressor of nem operon
MESQTMFDFATGPKGKLLNAALDVIRTQGYAGTSVDDICHRAGVTKGSFFHHFKSKDELALEAVAHWKAVTGNLFATAPFRSVKDPRDRVMAYIDFRAHLVKGELPEFTCLLGTLVQEAYATHPEIGAACGDAIEFHARTVEQDLAEAKRMYAPKDAWDPHDVALFTQAAIQGAFILAKAQGKPAAATHAIAHLRSYVASLLHATPTARKRRA